MIQQAPPLFLDMCVQPPPPGTIRLGGIGEERDCQDSGVLRGRGQNPMILRARGSISWALLASILPLIRPAFEIPGLCSQFWRAIQWLGQINWNLGLCVSGAGRGRGAGVPDAPPCKRRRKVELKVASWEVNQEASSDSSWQGHDFSWEGQMGEGTFLFVPGWGFFCFVLFWRVPVIRKQSCGLSAPGFPFWRTPLDHVQLLPCPRRSK